MSYVNLILGQPKTLGGKKGKDSSPPLVSVFVSTPLRIGIVLSFHTDT